MDAMAVLSRFSFIDIETQGLDPAIHEFLCGVCITLGGYYRFYQTPWRSERESLVAYKEALEEQWCIVGYNSMKFDLPFVNARLARHGLKPVRVKNHIDIQRIVNKRRISLVNVANSYGIPATKMDHSRCLTYLTNPDDAAYVLSECEEHCRLTQLIFERMQPSASVGG